MTTRMRTTDEIDPLMTFLFEERQRQGLTWVQLEVQSGLGTDTLRHAYHFGGDLRLRHLRSVLRTLGYELTLAPLDVAPR